MATRWGIASAGLISSDFVTALNLISSKEHKVVAVAARSKKSAQEFATRHRIEKSYEGYASLAADPDVQVVYVGGINPTHLEVSKMMLEGGKHVLCEKPLCMNVKETQELVAFARSKNLFLMEAVWSRFTPAYVALRTALEEKKLGEIKQVIVAFGREIDVPRMHDKSLGGGTVLDLGIYCIQFASLCFGHQKPEKVIAGGWLGQDGCDKSTSTTVLYSGSGIATLMTSNYANLPCEADVIGTKGSARISFPFWTPTEIKFSFESEARQFKLPEPEADSPAGSDPGYEVKFNFMNSHHFVHEANHVRECLKAGLTESPLVSLDETLIMAETMQSIRTQVGVVYPQD